MKSLSAVMNIAAPLIVYPYVCRVIKPEGVGAVNFAQNVIIYFQMIAMLGIPTYGIRAIAKVRDDPEQLRETFWEIFTINLICYAVSLALLGLTADLFSDKKLLLVMSSYMFFTVIGIEWYYSGLERYDFMAFWSLVFKLLMIAGVYLLVKTEADYIKYGFLYALGSVGAGIVYFLNLDVKRPEKLSLKKHWKPIAVFFAMSVATTIYTSMDSVMLGFISGETENGYYDAAVKVKMALVALITSLGTVLLPRSSNLVEKGDTETFRMLTKKALRYVLLFSIPCCILFIFIARPVVMILSGPLFEKSVLPMKIIMPTIVLIGITNITGLQVMVPLGREKYVLYSEIAGAVVNLIVNALLIPPLGAAGAAIGTVAAETAVLIVQVFLIWKSSMLRA